MCSSGSNCDRRLGWQQTSLRILLDTSRSSSGCPFTNWGGHSQGGWFRSHGTPHQVRVWVYRNYMCIYTCLTCIQCGFWCTDRITQILSLVNWLYHSSTRYTLKNITFEHSASSNPLLPRGEVDARGVFLLEERTGRLLTHASLTRYTHGTFSITVAAVSEPGQEPVYAKIKASNWYGYFKS